jgi:hypothetical protein
MLSVIAVAEAEQAEEVAGVPDQQQDCGDENAEDDGIALGVGKTPNPGGG